MKKATIKIGGMSCLGCVRSVTAVLTELAGVSNAEVSLRDGEAVVEYDPERVAPADMQRAVIEAGFESA